VAEEAEEEEEEADGAAAAVEAAEAEEEDEEEEAAEGAAEAGGSAMRASAFTRSAGEIGKKKRASIGVRLPDRCVSKEHRRNTTFEGGGCEAGDTSLRSSEAERRAMADSSSPPKNDRGKRSYK
jgi:hypothetical protein